MQTNIIVIENNTAERMAVITRRTRSEEMGIVKAMLIESLKAKLANGVAHFWYAKKNGEIREAWGTTQRNIAKAKTNGMGISREYYYTTAYYDIERGEWRSFRWENIIKVA